MKIKCIIVDDEPLAIDALSLLLEKFDELDLVGTSSDAFQAFEFLQKNKVDLMFLDIHMPELSGVNFLQSLTLPPRVIFTTAHREYALEAFELDVVDYLLKPISHQRLMKAINKFFQMNPPPAGKTAIQSSNEIHQSQSINVKSDRKTVKIMLDDILFIEGLKDYVRIITMTQNVITRMSLLELEKSLPEKQFLRIHRSYIVAISKITAFTNYDIEIGKEELPIGRMYKNQVLKFLEGH